MKKKDFQQFKIKPVAEMEKTLAENREKLWTMRTALVAGKVKNVKEIKDVKKTIAQILTVMQQKNGTPLEAARTSKK